MDLNGLDAPSPRGPSWARDGRGFEVLMRYCEVWRLYAHGKVSLDMLHDVTGPLFDHPYVDDNLPKCKWHENTDLQDYANKLAGYNARVWENTKTAICSKLGIPRRDNGFQGYSTRMVRHVVYGSNLASVQTKQITTPVVVPMLLEDYLLKYLPKRDHVPPHFVNSDATKVLIPVHDPSRPPPYTTSIPPLADTADESGNLRYWVITNKNMWANQHEVMDEFTELMWCIFKWFTSACDLHTDMNHVQRTVVKFDERKNIWALARYLRHRIILPEIPKDPLGLKRQGVLFKPWVIKGPSSQLAEEYEVGEDERPQQAGVATASTSTPEYALPKKYGWKEGDEGEWIGHDVPGWINVMKRKRVITPP